jgi:prevent-host-death family protein
MLKSKGVPMKHTPISTFQSQCYSTVKHVHTTGETVIITKHGKPLAKIVPIESSPADIFAFMAGEFQIIGDIEAPLFSE